MANGFLALYKTLNRDRSPCLGGKTGWPPPGEWCRVEGRLVPRKNGLHVCWGGQLVYWLGPVIWEVEVDGERIDQWDKIVVRAARLIRPVETWNEQVARHFAVDCASRALRLWEDEYPDDDSLRRAVSTARRYADGHASADALYRAGKLATYAARRARWAPLQDAAESCIWTTWPSAGAAARNAARYAALAVGPERERHRERQWQTAQLMSYLSGTPLWDGD